MPAAGAYSVGLTAATTVACAATSLRNSPRVTVAMRTRSRDTVASLELQASSSDMNFPDHVLGREPFTTEHSLLATALHSLRDKAPGAIHIQPTPAQLNDCAWVSNRWCELLPIPLELKQRLMTLDNPLVRLELVGDMLERMGIFL